ncbi:MAG TPA: MaoC family dehydratase [Candidatus Angelobacter sp.]|jgi:acyl dehydratase|nr:MaoC family dehydratase [Candidatus Angelobacter sp.]
MPPLVIESHSDLKDHVGKQIATTGWLTVTQDRIQQFADATGDHQWIHVDVERSTRESPYKNTIAHGFLTLSLLPQLMPQVLQIKNGVRMGINYGLNRVRFVSPVRAGSRIRAHFVLQSLKELEDGVEIVYAVTVEGEGLEKPACVAEWVVRSYR